jgi:hypothetical protein
LCNRFGRPLRLNGPWDRWFTDRLCPDGIGYLGKVAHLGTVFGEHDDVAILEKCLAHPLAVHKGAVGAAVNNLVSVALADDLGVVAGDGGDIGGELHLAGRVPSDCDGIPGELLDLTHEWALDVHQLDNDNRLFPHTIEEITGSEGMCQGDSASIHAGPLVKAVLIQGSVLSKQPSALCSDRE